MSTTLATTLASNNYTHNQTFINTTPSGHYNGRGNMAPPGCDSIAHDIDAEVILYIVFMALIMLCSVVGNLLTVFSIVMSSALKRRVTFYFIASLGKKTLLSFLFIASFQKSRLGADGIILPGYRTFRLSSVSKNPDSARAE